MSTIQSLGIGSGLKIDEIVGAIVDAEKVPKEESLKRREELTTAKVSAYGEIKSRLGALQSSMTELRRLGNFNQRQATSSDESAFTATASSLSDPGQYAISVDQLASAQNLATGTFASVDSVLGSGELTIDFGTTTLDPDTSAYGFTTNGGQSQTITLDASNNTLAGLKDHINANDYGVSASIINDGSGFRLVLAAESGQSNSMRINVNDTGDGNNSDASGLSQLAFNDSVQNLSQNVAGQDARLSLNGIAVTSQTNTVENAINGVTLTLNAPTLAAKNLSVTAETGAIKEQVQGMVEAYNELMTYTSELTAYSPGSGEGSLLLGDSTTRSLISQVRNSMFSQVEGVSSGLQALSNIGILSTQRDGTVEFDEAAFDKALATQPEQFQTLFSVGGTSTDANIQFVSSSSLTKPGNYDITIDQIASRALQNGASILPDFGAGGSITIDNDNDGFSVSINGAKSGPITLAQGTYTTGASLASALQNSINSDRALSDAKAQVTVTYDAANNRFDFESSTFGSKSSLSFTNLDANIASTLGINTGVSRGTNVSGTINGFRGVGDGQFLSVDSGPADGLKILVTGGDVAPGGASRGQVTFSRGIADQMNNLLTSMLEPKNGFLSTRLEGLDGDLERIKIDREALDFTIGKLETRLFAQFNAIDVTVGQLNNISSYLSSALETLPGVKKKE